MEVSTPATGLRRDTVRGVPIGDTDPVRPRAPQLLRRSALGIGAVGLAGVGVMGAAPSAFAASSAPSHGTTTCAIAGDECTAAISYANANDGGGATPLAVEADTEAHGGTVTHRVFDIRMQTNNGIYDIHVYRNDSAPYSDGVWWQKLAENQNPASGAGGSSTGTSPGSASSPDQGSASSPDQGSGSRSGSSSPASGNPPVSAGQAAANATSFVTGQGYQVLGVKHEQLEAKGQKDYYQVKLQLGQNGRKHGTTNVWVDASSAAGTVTAASGSGLQYRDPNVVAPAAAGQSALAATGGSGTVYKTSLHGGKWRWYWVFVRTASAKYKVGVDAVTGAVTQVR